MDPPGPERPWGIEMNSGNDGTQIPVHVDVRNNSIDPYFVNLIPAQVGGFVGGNVGTFYTGTKPPYTILSQPRLGWSYSPGRADFNLDGSVDLVLQDTNTTWKTWFMNGINYQTEASLTPSPPGMRVLGTADINGDGETDVFLTDGNGNVGYWLFRGNTFLQSVSLWCRQSNPQWLSHLPP
jgi:hypothetical protein